MLGLTFPFMHGIFMETPVGVQVCRGCGSRPCFLFVFWLFALQPGVRLFLWTLDWARGMCGVRVWFHTTCIILSDRRSMGFVACCRQKENACHVRPGVIWVPFVHKHMLFQSIQVRHVRIQADTHIVCVRRHVPCTGPCGAHMKCRARRRPCTCASDMGRHTGFFLHTCPVSEPCPDTSARSMHITSCANMQTYVFFRNSWILSSSSRAAVFCLRATSGRGSGEQWLLRSRRSIGRKSSGVASHSEIRKCRPVPARSRLGQKRGACCVRGSGM